ncbi:MAG: Rpn family recombination-promoting nuclease/putative transposase [Nannocystaceae bacterium]|nr:Rpn family recombination-promoting nuclease/putative transposase [Nannocystaceae bacterium]
MTSTPHDALFKSTFEQPEHAAAELRHMLPGKISSAIRWSTLALEPGSFVDAELADYHSDLLFSAEVEVCEERVLVYLLLEHQSTNDPMMAFRLLTYMNRIWDRYRHAHPGEYLPLVVPALLAQVPGGWSSPTRFADLFAPGVRELAKDVLPDFTYVVDDLYGTTDGELRKRPLADQAKVALWLMRDARDAAALLRRLADWTAQLEAVALDPRGEDAMLRLLRYIAAVSDDLHLGQFRASLKGLAPATERLTMTIEEQLSAAGIAKGRIVGRAEGLAEGTAKASAKAKASVLLVLGARGLHVGEADLQRIEACVDADQLDHWLRLAATVAAVQDIFEG